MRRSLPSGDGRPAGLQMGGTAAGGLLLNYDPYFSIGDAVAGLGIFLLIPQFLKPIYVFRLRVLGIGLRTLYALSGTGFLCVVTGALCVHYDDLSLPLFAIPWDGNWPAGSCMRPPTAPSAWSTFFRRGPALDRLPNMCRPRARFLASASEEDRVEFVADVLANIKKLIRIADLPGSQPRRITSLKLHFRRRSTADLAAYSQSFLGLLADPVFCRTLVPRLPWDAAQILVLFRMRSPAVRWAAPSSISSRATR